MQIYNSLSRKKEEFKPIHEGQAGIYSCGPTVYNYFHIGNARPFITFDVLRRQLEREGYKVTFVQNFTDIDDKMIRRGNYCKGTCGPFYRRILQGRQSAGNPSRHGSSEGHGPHHGDY